MIKGLIVDIDGVIVGSKAGFNFPEPHPDVLARLKGINDSGVTVSLCTAKPYFAVDGIVKGAGLSGLQITSGGGVIVNATDSSTVKSHLLDRDVVRQIVQVCLENDCYVEIFSELEYFAQLSQKSDTTVMHTKIYQRDPIFVDSLLAEVDKQDIVKVMPIARDDQAMDAINKYFSHFSDQASIGWVSQPAALPWRLCVITAKGISKAQGSHEVAEYYGISTDELLGIGDSTADWQFIEACGYAGATGNASDELKRLVKTRGDNSFIGGDVDDNGVLEIFDYFEL
ncbi:MAG: HAD family hydrolase [Candidatus Saccharimonadales bacterium]